MTSVVLLTGLVLLAAGCSSDSVDTWQRGGLPAGITDQTDRITTLWVGSWVAALAAGLLVWGLIIYAVVVFRRRATDTGLPAQVRYNLPIEVLYTTAPLVVVLVFFFFTVRDQTEILRVSDDQDHVVNVVGKRWSWDFNYLDAEGNPIAYEPGTPGEPPTLYLPVGESVEFVLTARDVVHSFWVPAFLFKLDTIPGRVNRFQVTPTQEGSFVGKCAELCGVDHSRMLFTVAVVSPEEYDDHLDELVERGQTGDLPADLGPDLRVDNNPATEREGEQ